MYCNFLKLDSKQICFDYEQVCISNIRNVCWHLLSVLIYWTNVVAAYSHRVLRGEKHTHLRRTGKKGRPASTGDTRLTREARKFMENVHKGLSVDVDIPFFKNYSLPPAQFTFASNPASPGL